MSRGRREGFSDLAFKKTINSFEIEQLQEALLYKRRIKTLQEHNQLLKEKTLDEEITNDYIEELKALDTDNKDVLNKYFEDLEKCVLDEEEKTIEKAKAVENVNYILKQAFLKETNKKKLQKVEDDYLKNLYGDMYFGLKEKSILESFTASGKILYPFCSLIRYLSSQPDSFLKVLLSIEKNMSKNVLKEGGFSKFIFKANNNWVAFNYKSNKFYKLDVGKGPWNFYDLLFTEKNSIYIGNDIFNCEGLDVKKAMWLDNFYKNMRYLSKICESDFCEMDKEECCWSIFMMPCEYSKSEHELREKVEELITKKTKKNEENENPNAPNKENKDINIEETELEKNKETEKGVSFGNNYNKESTDKNYSIDFISTKMFFICALCTGTKSKIRNFEKKEIKDQIHISKKRHSEKMNTEINVETKENENLLNKIDNQIKNDNDEDNDENGDTRLPMSLLVEIIKNFSDMCSLYGDNMFLKMTEFMALYHPAES